jgi:5-formyltetrahydrofolate cyclo-ligase
MNPREHKRRLREELLTRPYPPPDVRRRVIEHVSDWLEDRRPGVVVGFLAMGDEIDMNPLVEAHPRIRFGLTRTAQGVRLTVHDYSAPRERHRFGFEQPVADAPPIPLGDVDVVLVPGLAFGPDGRRLGRGAGYYDRFLAEIDADTVGLTTRDRIRTDIPVESHDILVRWLATEDGVSRAA